jgi:type VI secretion system protein ImpL
LSLALYIVLGVAVAALVVLVVLYFQKKKAAAPGSSEVSSGSSEIAALIHEAEAKLSAAKLGTAARVGNLPVYLVIGDPGATKTSIIQHCGLDPELIAGQVFQGGNVASTRTANLWFSRRSLFVEGGGALLSEAGRWHEFIRKLQPRSAVFGKGEQAGRAAVVCFDCENFTKAGSMDLAVNAARNLRARLGEVAQALGINLPVYVLFTKIDRLPYFVEYVRNLNSEEATQVLGVSLPMINRRSEGVYAEEESARLTAQFERLFRALADARPEFLARETDPTKLPAAYEFPREFHKIRPAVVQFLIELCRPSQLTTGPFLRGFYFTGVRPVVTNEAAPVAAAQPAQQQFAGPADATSIFHARPEAQPLVQQAAARPVISTRKVPQWLFLSHLFNDVLLADRAAMGASGASTRTSQGRRILFIAAATVCLLLTAAFTISFFNNRALENRVHGAAAALASVEPGTELAAAETLRKLESLRQTLETLGTYRREGAPLFYRWLLYVGDDLYPVARKAYFDRFRAVMFGQTQDAILRYLRGLPATPGPDYSPTYDALKAYLITTSEFKRSTPTFLTPVLMGWWMGGRTADSERQQFARRQFDFYAVELKSENPYSSEADGLTVEKSRRYLKQFAGLERVYNFMLAEADRQNKPVNFNRDFPGSAQYVVNSHEVRGAFTKGGFSTVKDAIANLDKYLNGEPWVLGEQGVGIADRAGLETGLRAHYSTDFLAEWRAYIKASSVVGYKSLADASQKLKQLSGNQSALMELFALASQNTAVDDPKLAAAFQPVQTVVPPPATQFTSPANQGYLQALLQLSSSIDAASQGGNDAAAQQTLNDARQAKQVAAQVGRAFAPDLEAHIDQQVQKLLEDPITNVEGLLRKLGPDELNAQGARLCAQIHPALAKYPFSPKGSSEATIADLVAVFKPKEGALWQFVEGPLAKAVSKQGSQYAANPAGGVTVNPAFLGWLNRAQAFTELVFGDSANPHFRYTIKPDLSADMDSITLTVDGQTQTFTAPAAAKTFEWPGTAQGEQISVRFRGSGDPFGVDEHTGRWAIFRFVDDAETHTGSRIETTFRYGRANSPITHNGQPVKLRMDISPQIFDRGYFAGLGCITTVAK